MTDVPIKFRFMVSCDRDGNKAIEKVARSAGKTVNEFVQGWFGDFVAMASGGRLPAREFLKPVPIKQPEPEQIPVQKFTPFEDKLRLLRYLVENADQDGFVMIIRGVTRRNIGMDVYRFPSSMQALRALGAIEMAGSQGEASRYRVLKTPKQLWGVE